MKIFVLLRIETGNRKQRGSEIKSFMFYFDVYEKFWFTSKGTERKVTNLKQNKRKQAELSS